jgi:hypothetical protein
MAITIKSGFVDKHSFMVKAVGTEWFLENSVAFSLFRKKTEVTSNCSDRTRPILKKAIARNPFPIIAYLILVIVPSLDYNKTAISLELKLFFYFMTNWKTIQSKNNFSFGYLLLLHKKLPFFHDFNNAPCYSQLGKKRHIFKTENAPLFAINLPSVPSL